MYFYNEPIFYLFFVEQYRRINVDIKQPGNRRVRNRGRHTNSSKNIFGNQPISKFSTIFHRAINFKLLDRVARSIDIFTYYRAKSTKEHNNSSDDTDQSRAINFSSQHFFISLLKFSFVVVKSTRIKGAKLFIRVRGYNRLPDPLSHQRATLCETISVPFKSLHPLYYLWKLNYISQLSRRAEKQRTFEEQIYSQSMPFSSYSLFFRE